MTAQSWLMLQVAFGNTSTNVKEPQGLSPVELAPPVPLLEMSINALGRKLSPPPTNRDPCSVAEKARPRLVFAFGRCLTHPLFAVFPNPYIYTWTCKFEECSKSRADMVSSKKDPLLEDSEAPDLSILGDRLTLHPASTTSKHLPRLPHGTAAVSYTHLTLPTIRLV